MLEMLIFEGLHSICTSVEKARKIDKTEFVGEGRCPLSRLLFRRRLIYKPPTCGKSSSPVSLLSPLSSSQYHRCHRCHHCQHHQCLHCHHHQCFHCHHCHHCHHHHLIIISSAMFLMLLQYVITAITTFTISIIIFTIPIL